ncbi:hypothetical protein P9597_28980 [Aneurinibacillus migulanus]|uniref:hypothetical protein n=1 Tax=Aneurinibacillus migulanus TaxID=47500 RepID=UPI002E235EF5|nr:hypothetical protein [Aneurinibacillus migulanus]
MMYIVSDKRIQVPAIEIDDIQKETGTQFPSSYKFFLTQYGEGTYCGWVNITRPDPEVLQPFVEYDLWLHDEECPITQAQIKQCVSIGTSIDGDFLAVHPQTEGILWFPRHAEKITLKPCREDLFTHTLDRIYREEYKQNNSVPAFFEPWNDMRIHTFFLFSSREGSLSMPALARLCKERFQPDLVFENEYTCKIFLQALGGYVRFNYAYGVEIAVFYEKDRSKLYEDISLFLQQHNCQLHS